MKKIAVILAIGFTLSACSHGLMRGSVAMKISDQEAHVCMGKNEVKPGDRVALFSNECPVAERRFTGCKKVKVGEGEIIQVINEHYSVLKVPHGVSFHEGTVVEKQ